MGHRFAMKKFLIILSSVLIYNLPVLAQFGGGSAAPSSDTSLDELFSGNPVFSATQIADITGPNGHINVKTQMYFDHGNSRSEMNMADVQGSLPPNALAQMKAIGLDKVVTINPASKTSQLTIYPNIRSYFSTAVPAAAKGASNSITITKIGSESVGGHSCIKNSVVVTSGGESHQFTTWNATDLRNFPIEIAISDQGTSVTMTFQNVSFAAIPAYEFQPPSAYSHYDNIQALMQAAMMSRMSASPTPPRTPNQ